jgi:hypothetical protein
LVDLQNLADDGSLSEENFGILLRWLTACMRGLANINVGLLWALSPHAVIATVDAQTRCIVALCYDCPEHLTVIDDPPNPPAALDSMMHGGAFLLLQCLLRFDHVEARNWYERNRSSLEAELEALMEPLGFGAYVQSVVGLLHPDPGVRFQTYHRL